jgi:O-antigen/teichoic acid export membrane protein
VSQIRRTIRNLGHVVGGEVLLRAANFGVVVLIGRVYGVTTLGSYAAILAVATLAERLADNGLELTGVVEVSRSPQSKSEIATVLYVNKTVLSLVAIFTLVLLAVILRLSTSQWLIAAALTIRTFLYSYSRLNAGILKALDSTRPIVKIQALHFAILVICVAFVYVGRQSLLTLLLCLVAAQTLELTLSSVVLYKLGIRPKAVSASLCWQLLRRSTPIGAIYTLSNLMLRGDVLVLSLIASTTVVGIFAAADTGLVMVYVVAWLYSGILLSDLGSLSNDRSAFDMHFRKCLRLVILVSVPLATLSIFLAPLVIRLLFGHDLASAGVPAALMMVALPFIFLNASFVSRSIAKNASRTCLWIFLFISASSLLLNFLFGRWEGAAGVAGSIVIREVLMTLLFVRLWNLPEKHTETSTLFATAKPEYAANLNS